MAKYNTIVVGTDFSPLAQVAVEAAVQVAKRFDAQALHLVHVVNTSSAAAVFPYAVPEAQLANIYEEGAERAKVRLDELPVDYPAERVHRTVHLGLPARALAESTEQLSADLIVVASHGFGPIRRTILGSVAGALIRSAACPVLVVGEERHTVKAFENVLAAIDLSNVSEAVLRHAVGLTNGGGRVVALSMYEHPLSTYDEGDLLRRYLSDQEISAVGDRHREAVQTMVDAVDHENVEIRVGGHEQGATSGRGAGDREPPQPRPHRGRHERPQRVAPHDHRVDGHQGPRRSPLPGLDSSA